MDKNLGLGCMKNLTIMGQGTRTGVPLTVGILGDNNP